MATKAKKQAKVRVGSESESDEDEVGSSAIKN